MTTNTENAKKPNAIKRAVFMLGIPAESISWYASLFLIVGFVSGAIAVIASSASSVLSNAASELSQEENKKNMAAANERIDAQRLETAKALERAANAELRAAEAKLALENLKAPRRLGAEQRGALITPLKQFKGQQFHALLPPAGLDTEAFWAQLDEALRAAGWTRAPNPPGLVVGDPPAGIAINAAPGISVGFAFSRKADVGVAAAALTVALNSAGIGATLTRDSEAEKNPNLIRIVIGLKPHSP